VSFSRCYTPPIIFGLTIRSQKKKSLAPTRVFKSSHPKLYLGISQSQTQSYWPYCLSWCWLHHCHHKLPFPCGKGSRPLTSLWSGWIRCHCTPSPTFFFNCNSSNKIEFWDFPSKTRWHLHAKVDDHTKSTIVPSTPSQFMSLDAIREKSSKACADQWITTFNRGHNKGYQFLQLRIHEKKCIHWRRGMAQTYWVLEFRSILEPQ